MPSCEVGLEGIRRKAPSDPTVGNMKAFFAQKALYSSSRILPPVSLPLPRTRVPSRALRYLSLRATGGVFLQEARILPQLWRPPYGRDSGPSLGRGIPRCAIASMGDQFSVSSTVPVCRPPSGNGQGAGHYLPRNFYASDPQGWIPTPGRGDWCGNVDTTLRISLKPQYTFSHPVSGWRLCISRRSITPISTPQSAG